MKSEKDKWAHLRYSHLSKGAFFEMLAKKIACEKYYIVVNQTY